MLELKGYLRCADAAEADRVARGLPEHIRLTRAEPGCLRFEVAQTDDPLVWTVFEQFADRAAFEAHQRRALKSDWAVLTRGIVRDYHITE